MGDEVEFLPADEHKSFLQDDSTTLGVHSQTGLKYQKQPVSLKYLKENMKDEVDFLPADECWSFFQIDTLILGVWPGMLKLPKITSLLFA